MFFVLQLASDLCENKITNKILRL